MRATVLGLVAATLAGCAVPAVVREPLVAARPPLSDADSAVVLSYPATLCSVTLRDESGRLHDREERDGGSVPIDMTRAVLDLPWQSYRDPPSLLTVLALPPGRYTLTQYATADDRTQVESSSGLPWVRADCDGSVTVHPVRISIRVEPGQLTLLDLPRGGVDFGALGRMSYALQNPTVLAGAGAWVPAVRRAGSSMHRELARRQRQPREGYDVYPNCDGKLAVVRTLGKPFDWYVRPDDQAARSAFRASARAKMPFPAHSVQATGFGAGCVKPHAFVYLLTDPAELEPLARALGEMLVTEDLAGEIDLVLTGPIEPHEGPGVPPHE